MSEEHRRNVEKYVRENDIRVIQGAPVTEQMIQDNWRKVVTPPPATSFVTPQQIEARDAHQRAVDIQQQQTRQLAEEKRLASLSPEDRYNEEDLQAKIMLVDISKAKENKARSQGQWAAAERYGLEREQREANLAQTLARQAALAERRTTDLVLQADPDFRYALTAAEVNRDLLDPMSADAIENSVFINDLKSATPENFRSVVADFHAWDAQRYARIREEKQLAEVAALQQAAPAIDAMHRAAQDAAAAGLKAAEAAARSQGYAVPAAAPPAPGSFKTIPEPLDAGAQAARQEIFKNYGQAT